ncbi:MAG: hypothetical protein ABW034_20205 [Steroidobacteraceae bacterium]
MLQLKPGMRLRSAVCTTEMVVVRAPKVAVTVECGGTPMLPHGTQPPAGLSLASEFSAGTQVGKRYADETTGLELLCSKAGNGSLSIDGKPVAVKDAKKLPSSD